MSGDVVVCGAEVDLVVGAVVDSVVVVSLLWCGAAVVGI